MRIIAQELAEAVGLSDSCLKMLHKQWPKGMPLTRETLEQWRKLGLPLSWPARRFGTRDEYKKFVAANEADKVDVLLHILSNHPLELPKPPDPTIKWADRRPCKHRCQTPDLSCDVCWQFLHDEKFHALWNRPMPRELLPAPNPVPEPSEPRELLPPPRELPKPVKPVKPVDTARAEAIAKAREAHKRIKLPCISLGPVIKECKSCGNTGHYNIRTCKVHGKCRLMEGYTDKPWEEQIKAACTTCNDYKHETS